MSTNFHKSDEVDIEKQFEKLLQELQSAEAKKVLQSIMQSERKASVELEKEREARHMRIINAQERQLVVNDKPQDEPMEATKQVQINQKMGFNQNANDTKKKIGKNHSPGKEFQAMQKECELMERLAQVIDPPLSLSLTDQKQIDQGSAAVDDIRCMICFDLVWEPAPCAECKKAFCAQCMSSWRKNTKTCPHCKAHFCVGSIPTDKRASFKQPMQCQHCSKQFLFDEWSQHARICEQSRLKCACGMIITANHALEKDGSLPQDSMTNFRIHTMFECSLTRSNCSGCVKEPMDRVVFEMHHCQAKIPQENEARKIERMAQLRRAVQGAKRGRIFVCSENKPLVPHHKLVPSQYAEDHFFCTGCNKKIEPLKKDPATGENPIYYRCAEQCKCDMNFCSQCFCCPKGHPLEVSSYVSTLQSQDTWVKCSLCEKTLKTHDLDNEYLRCRQQCLFNACENCRAELFKLNTEF